MDSNFRYPVATVIGGQPSWEKALVARIRERIYWDRRFESTPLQHRFLSRGTRGESSAGLKVPRGSQKCTSARELEGTGFELVWGFLKLGRRTARIACPTDNPRGSSPLARISRHRLVCGRIV